MTEPRTCGSCTLCCKTMLIEALQKPIGQWCAHCDIGRGCKIYEARPQACRSFRCGWLQDPSMPDALRPDRSKVILDMGPDGRLMARCDASNPTAWKKEPLYSRLKAWSRMGWARGETVFAVAYPRVWLIAPDEDVDLGTPPVDARFHIGRTPGGRVKVTVLPPV